MNDKCKKYPGLFIFSDEQTLMKHVSQCDDCKIEQQKMERVSEVLQEVKTYFVKQRTNMIRLRAVCTIALLLFGGITFGFAQTHSSELIAFLSNEHLSAEDLGFPTDSYGFIMVD